jgi:hypothetical protein
MRDEVPLRGEEQCEGLGLPTFAKLRGEGLGKGA